MEFGFLVGGKRSLRMNLCGNDFFEGELPDDEGNVIEEL